MNIPSSAAPSSHASPTGQRHNAVKHGLLAEGITELDDPQEYTDTLADLEDDYEPTSRLESILLSRMALCTVRLRRAAVMEAEYIDSKLACRTQADPVTTRHRLSTYQVENLNKTYHRYEAAIENRLFRTLKHFQDLRKTHSQGFENAEGAAPSRPRRCRRRPGYMSSNRPAEASETPPSQTPEIQPDPTGTPLHYQTDFERDDHETAGPAPIDPTQSFPGRDAMMASAINSVSPAPGMDDSSEAVHHDASPIESSFPHTEPKTVDVPMDCRQAPSAEASNPNPTLESFMDASTLSATDAPGAVRQDPPAHATAADSNQHLLTERFYTILNNMDLANITEWIHDNPGRILELMRLLGFHNYQSALRDKVLLEVTKLNNAIKASQPSALASKEVDEETTVKMMTAYAHAMNKYLGVG